MAMKETTRKVFEYLKEHNGEDLTAADIARVLGFSDKRQVDGIFTSAIQRKEYGYREPGEVTLSDGNHQKVKFLRLTEKGLELDLNVE